MMKRTAWFLHPVFIFVFSIIALGLSLFLYIYWYVEVSVGLQVVIKKFNLDPGQFWRILEKIETRQKVTLGFFL